MHVVLGVMLKAVIVGLVVSLLSALSLAMAVRWLQKTNVSYWKAYLTMFLGGTANVAFGCVVALGLGAVTGADDISRVMVRFMWPVGFLIQSLFISKWVRIPFGRSCLVCLATIGMNFAMILVIAVPVIVIVELVK